MPISSTITSVSSGLSRMVTGRPCSLLKLRGLAAVRRVLANAAASRSLVEVLPTDPVMPTTLSGRRERAHPPSAISAAAVSSTSIMVRPGGRPSDPTGRLVSEAAAPAENASAMWSCPSRAATIGTKSDPGRRERESNEAPSIHTSGPCNRPPVAAAASLERNRIAATYGWGSRSRCRGTARPSARSATTRSRTVQTRCVP